MIRIKLNEFRSSITECSYSDANSISMINDRREVFNFDDIKKEYQKLFPKKICGELNSNDVLFENEGKWFFIEFKNGVIDNIKNTNIKYKIYDSILILLDILNCDLEFCRNNVSYILIFNEQTINDPHYSRQFDREVYLKCYEMNPSNAFESIVANVNTLAGNFGRPQFGLGKFENFIFNKVYTIPKFKYHELMNKILSS